MFELLQKIRNKPEKTKKQIAVLVSLFIAGVIFVIWLTVIYPDFSARENKVAQITADEPSPLSTLGDTVSGAFSSIGNQFAQLKDAVSSLASSTSQGTTTTEEVPSISAH